MSSNREPSTDASFWQLTLESAFDRLGSRPSGLSSAEAEIRRARFGFNTIEGPRRAGSFWLLARQFQSPIILILVVATVLAGLLGDVTDTVIILAIIALSGLLGFWQERGAAQAVAALLAVVRVQAEVIRDGTAIDLTPKEYTVLEYLMRHAGRVMSRTLITEYAWGYHFDPGTNIVDVVINHLRKKVDAKHARKLISTVRGVGYVLKE